MGLDQQEPEETITSSLTKERIVLCMIVKNEERIITRALDSVNEIVDQYVICDTGSSDGTVSAVEKYFEDNDLCGTVYERPWVNFAHNRKEHGDYIMTLDADEVFAPLETSGPNLFSKVTALPPLNVDRVDVPTHLGNVVYPRSQFFKTTKKWIWASPCHEVCISNEAQTSDVLPNVCVVPTNEGARSQNPKKFFDDALIFEREVLDNSGDARSWFYLAQSYRDAGRPDKAIEPLEKCIEVSNWPEEKSTCYLRLARFGLENGKSFDDVLHYYWKSFNYYPKGEALYDMLRHYRKNGIYRTGAVIGEMFEKYNVGPGALFAEASIYDWQWKDELSVCYYYLNKHTEAIALIDSIIDLPQIPENEQTRMRQTGNT